MNALEGQGAQSPSYLISSPMYLIPPAAGEELGKTVREPGHLSLSWAQGETTARSLPRRPQKTAVLSPGTMQATTEAAGFIRNSGGEFQQVAVQGQSEQQLRLTIASASLSPAAPEDPLRMKVTGSSTSRLALGMPHTSVDQCPVLKRGSVKRMFSRGWQG